MLLAAGEFYYSRWMFRPPQAEDQKWLSDPPNLEKQFDFIRKCRVNLALSNNNISIGESATIMQEKSIPVVNVVLHKFVIRL